jgi:hypothetical protein
MFRDADNAYDYGPDLADVTAEFLAKNAPYTPYVDGRITQKYVAYDRMTGSAQGNPLRVFLCHQGGRRRGFHPQQGTVC